MPEIVTLHESGPGLRWFLAVPRNDFPALAGAASGEPLRFQGMPGGRVQPAPHASTRSRI
jgi:hypothetical protein